MELLAQSTIKHYICTCEACEGGVKILTARMINLMLAPSGESLSLCFNPQ